MTYERVNQESKPASQSEQDAIEQAQVRASQRPPAKVGADLDSCPMERQIDFYPTSWSLISNLDGFISIPSFVSLCRPPNRQRDRKSERRPVVRLAASELG